VSALQVVDAEAHLRARCALALALVQREVQKRRFGPGDRSVTAADPAIVVTVLATLMIREVQIETEAISRELDRPLEVRDLEHEGDQTSRFGHEPILSEAWAALATMCRSGARRLPACWRVAT
jgi:hypothetical protein